MTARSGPTVEVVIPAYNEERALPLSIPLLHAELGRSLPHPWTILIVDNGSLDATLQAAQELAVELPQVRVLHLEQKGRGRALRRAWMESEAEILSYMDVDLSTDLSAFPRSIQALLGGADIAIGSRLLPESRVERSFRRETMSRGYNLLIRALFQVHFSDAQCGFKALRRPAARALVPLIQDQAWFFDTELLLLAERYSFRIAEIPVIWKEDPDSRVRILSTAWEDLKGLWRLRWRPPPRSAIRGPSPH